MFRYSITFGGRIAALVAALQFATAALGQQRAPNDSLVVHEWGTFTSLQDERGNAIAGINADDEPVPEFVHRLNYRLIVGPQRRLMLFAKSVPQCHPDVTMRLETPVVYFHPGRGMDKPQRVNVEVAFHGGWLSEYYPKAEVEAPGVKSFGPITSATVGRVKWNDLQVGTDAPGPETKAQVWLAPRAVEASNVTAAGGETERYLFYRGIGHLDSPLRVSRDNPDPAHQSLVITSEFPAMPQPGEDELAVPALWLVDVRQDKACAFRKIDGFRVPNGGRPRAMARTPAGFDNAQYDVANIEELSSSVRAALIEDGLFADEADALLNTWRTSYFENPGLRLFYLLPRAWTDHVMPMKLSVDAKLVRTMVGRVEIVTPAQRQLLGQIAAGPASKADWQIQDPESCRASAVPADYEAFQSLGRFRNALVLDELKHRPTESLQTFVNNYGLAAFVPTPSAAAIPTEATATIPTAATTP